jgi:hypothetical protein
MDIEIYPNPVINTLTLKDVANTSSNLQIELYNSMGTKVRDEHITLPVTLTLTDLQTGIYQLIVKDSNGMVVKVQKLVCIK